MPSRLHPFTFEPTGAPAELDADALWRHAVCVDMTGSGKTGLCVGLLESLAGAGVPILALDPKAISRTWHSSSTASRQTPSPHGVDPAEAELLPGARPVREERRGQHPLGLLLLGRRVFEVGRPAETRTAATARC